MLNKKDKRNILIYFIIYYIMYKTSLKEADMLNCNNRIIFILLFPQTDAAYTISCLVMCIAAQPRISCDLIR